MDGDDNGTGGCQPTFNGGVIQGGGAGNPSIWVGDVGDAPPHGKGPGKFPEQDRQVDYGEAAIATVGWELGVTTAGDSDGGGGV